MGKNLCAPGHDLTTFQRCQGKCLSFRYVFGCFGALNGAYGVMASLDVYKTGWRGKLGLDKISGPMQHHFNHFSKVLGEMRLFKGSFMVF